MKGKLSSEIGMGFPETDSFELKNFRIRWNKINIPVKNTFPPKGKQYQIGSLSLPSIFKFTVPPGKNEIHSLITEYDFDAPKTGGSKEPEGIYVEYILQTGAAWDSKIGEVVFLMEGEGFDCTKVLLLNGSYKGSCNEKNQYYYRAADIEPNKDFRFILLDSS